MSGNLPSRPSSGGRSKQAVHSLQKDAVILAWISKLAKALGTECSQDRQSEYLEALSDLPVEALNRAFMRARLESKYFPQIPEIREFAHAVLDENALEERSRRATERWLTLERAALISGAAPQTVKSLLDGQPSSRVMLPGPRRDVEPQTESQYVERMDLLRRQYAELKKREAGA